VEEVALAHKEVVNKTISKRSGYLAGCVHVTPLDLSKRVPLIKAVIGIDQVLDTILATGIDGLVVEAFGRGNLSAELGQRLVRVCGDGVPVVVTSRCPSGRVMPIYGGGGGGRDLEDAGVIFSGDLKARPGCFSWRHLLPPKRGRGCGIYFVASPPDVRAEPRPTCIKSSSIAPND
jgi:L-asparaginase/Glu-tRNA(Gln) amidotransferase subunit D